MVELLCPKDQTPMRGIERNGVMVERCPECGGMFLDRGEFERLASAEMASAEREDRVAQPQYGDDRRTYPDDPRAYGGEHGGGGHGGGSGTPRKKRKGFLSDFLDFG